MKRLFVTSLVFAACVVGLVGLSPHPASAGIVPLTPSTTPNTPPAQPKAATGAQAATTPSPAPAASIGGAASKLSFSIPCKLKLNSNGCTDIVGVLNTIVTILMSVASTLFVFMILWGAIQYVSGAGVPAQTQAAKTTMLNAGIGLVIVLGAWAIIYFVITSLQPGGVLDSSSPQSNPTTSQSSSVPMVTGTPEGSATSSTAPGPAPTEETGTPETTAYTPPAATPRAGFTTTAPPVTYSPSGPAPTQTTAYTPPAATPR